MKPFAFKWSCVGIPMQAETDGGYDVVSAAAMSGYYAPAQITEERRTEIDLISKEAFWADCESSIRRTLEGFEQHGITLPKQEYVFTVLLSDPNSSVTAMAGDYCGDGGIPGYIIGSIVPNERSLALLPVALAHETNHNVRWQFMQWSNQITLADMIVSEGLAETFAASMFGEGKVGKWVRETSPETLQDVVKPLHPRQSWDKRFWDAFLISLWRCNHGAARRSAYRDAVLRRICLRIRADRALSQENRRVDL